MTFAQHHRGNAVHRSAALLLALLTGLLLIGAAPAAAADPETPRERLVVGFAAGADLSGIAAHAWAAGGEYEGRVPGLDAVVVEVPPARAAAARRALARTHGVRFVEPDAVITLDAVEPNDPLWSSQWGPKRVRAPEAWERTTGKSSVRVAVLDTGVADHPDLEGAVAQRVTFVGGDEWDHFGHGTMTAGVLAARGHNAEGVAGLCWTCTLLSAKVLDDDGTGSTSSVAAGIVWAADEGADVISMSFGSESSSTLLHDAVRYAHSKDVLLVASAGNDGTTAKRYPAAYDEVVAVAGSDKDDARYSWSNHGTWVEVAAPGCNYTTLLEATYGGYCGTSSATPVVSGVLALARALGATTPQALDGLHDGAVAVDYVTSGRVDAYATLELVVAALSSIPEEDDGSDASDADEDELTLVRLAGANRYETAAKISSAVFDENVSRVYVTTGVNFPDALAAGAAAGHTDAPVLLTTRDVLPDATVAELKRLAPSEIVVVGGEIAVSAEVEKSLRTDGVTVRRIAGRDRYATAASVARDAFEPGVPVAYVATGIGFADALAAVPAAAHRGGPVLLTAPDRLPAATADALAALEPEQIVVLGGKAAVADAVVSALEPYAPGEVIRLAGKDRYETAAFVARTVFPSGASQAYLATGLDFPDALAGGAAAGVVGAPLLLSTHGELPAATADELARLTPREVSLLGGTGALADTIESALTDLLLLL